METTKGREATKIGNLEKHKKALSRIRSKSPKKLVCMGQAMP